MSDKIDLDSLKLGDRILLRIKEKGSGAVVDRFATYLGKDKTAYGDEHHYVYLDIPVALHSIGYSWRARRLFICEAVKKLGLNALTPNCWVLDNYSEVREVLTGASKTTANVAVNDTPESSSDWRAWAHNIPGECACGIRREACKYHR